MAECWALLSVVFQLLQSVFEVRNPQGAVLLEVESPFWRLWTFPFRRRGRELARISKKWSGVGFEMSHGSR